MIFEFVSPIESYMDIKLKSRKKISLKKYGFLELNKKGLYLFIDNQYIEVRLLNNEYPILDLLRKNLKTVVYIDWIGKDNIINANIYFFYFYKKLPKLSISIDDKILKDFNCKDFNKLKKKLKKSITIKINNKNYYLMGIFDKDNFEIEKDSFLLYAEGYALVINSKKIDENNYELKITKVIRRKPQKENNLILLETDLEFSSDLISDRISKELQEIIKNENSYINVWDKFLAYEAELLLDRAREIGLISIKNIIPRDRFLEIVLEKKIDLEVGENITFLEKEPFYFDENISFTEFSATLQQEFENGRKEKELFFEIKDKKENSIFIDFIDFINFNELKKYKIGLSIFGDKVQITRKLKARELILKGKSANPYLGLILEDGNVNLDFKPTKIEPLSEFVEKKIFKYPPTENQKEAISIAINTPDIAIIQGPPGTGKTTVITAIIERINELKDKDKIKGSILVAGYQHDAVLNLVQRLNLNSLPTVKFGSKNEEKEFEKYQLMLEWAKDIKEKAKKNIRNYSEYKKLKLLDDLIKNYIKLPSNETALNILEKLSEILPNYMDKIEELKKNFIDEIFDINSLKEIYALRINKNGFLDDGKERIDDLLRSNFILILTNDEIEKLKKKDISYLEDYKQIKIKLIEYFYPKAHYKKLKPNEEFIAFLEEIKKELENGNTKQDKINKLLIDYVNELENNPFALFEMVKDYSLVFASSVQQSDRKEIEDEKENEFYDYVIIDEAGRVPPMDLLIPMVKGKKIILVGDHRQLPHLIDEKILKEISKKENIEENLIKKSMFEYLISKVKKLEKKDGIKRVITLKNQYRMHPVMGEFISKNFYEKYNSEEAFKSPLPETMFKYNLKLIENKPCVWIDVPNNLCGEKSDSFNSKYRECEAKKIIEYLKLWVYSEEGEKLTYGIISFYKAQVKLIKKLLEKELPDKKDKIKVGSVDAFQGMEFDIVFLSTVRSKRELIGSVQSLFGFLVSKNRLNVAMSRQKKVLIVVGDKKYFQTDIAKQYVPELNEFINLCENKGKIL
jgi:nucleoside-triphosphatase THEP1